MEEVVKDCKSGSEISEKLLNFASDISKDKKLAYFQDSRSVEAKNNTTGKLDDAATAFFEYNPA
jgi:hypothetical protein